MEAGPLMGAAALLMVPPLTYAAGGPAKRHRGDDGGVRARVFRGLSWAVWFLATAVLSSSPSAPSPAPPTSAAAWWGAAAGSGTGADAGGAPPLRGETRLGAALFTVVLSEVFMLSSLLAWEDAHAAAAASPAPAERAVPAPASPPELKKVSPRPGIDRAKWGAVNGLGFALTLLAVGMLWLALREDGGAGARGPRDRLVLVALSALGLIVAATKTHGLGGRLAHRRHRAVLRVPSLDRLDSEPVDPEAAAAADAWAFWQPGRGGRVFVAAQVCGWTLFAAGLLALLVTARLIVRGVVACELVCFRTLGLTTSACMLAAQAALGWSILHFDAASPGLWPSAAPPTKAAAAAEGAARGPAQGADAGSAALLVVMYAPHYLAIAALCAGYALLPPRLALAALACYYGPWLAASAPWRPADGGRLHARRGRWPAFEAWVGAGIEAVARDWFGGLDVRVEAPARHRASPARRVFAYHPHGLYPCGLTWFHRTRGFREVFGAGVRPITLVASVIFKAPLLSDLSLWGGCREVTRRAFRHHLRADGAVALCPGGQAELCLVPRAHRRPAEGPQEVALCTRHRGFVRLALEQGAALVPVFCFGEIHGTSNLINLPRVQEYTYRRLGFPVPFLAGGRWGLPLPRPGKPGHPLAFVVGRPVPTAPEAARLRELALGEAEGMKAREAAVGRLHAAYYREVAALYERHKGRYGYTDVRLAFSHPLAE